MRLGGSLYVSGLSGKRNQRRGLGWEGERDEEEKKKSRRREETGEEDKMKGAGGNVKIDTTVKGRGGKRDGRREGVGGGECFHRHLYYSRFKPEPRSSPPNLDDVPCSEHIMNATLLSVD